jgi:hypothetical protein
MKDHNPVSNNTSESCLEMEGHYRFVYVMLAWQQEEVVLIINSLESSWSVPMPTYLSTLLLAPS